MRPTTRIVPLHWSMLLGIISLSCLFVLVATGAVLMVYFDPSSDTVQYHGSYPLLQGVRVSEAYASTLYISLEVPGGLLVRQAHHWAALILPGTLLLQMLTTFFTGGFRRPRHWSWVLLGLTFLLALAGGWSGYGLPDDLLSGTGLRIAHSILIGIPVIGTWASLFLLGGEFPAHVVERMYWLHVAVVPALLGAVLLLRLRLSLSHRPPQFPSRGRTESNVVGLPILAIGLRALGLFLMTTGVVVLIGGLVAISPMWKYGPSSTSHASAGSQPDWYTSFLDGALRLVPSGWDVTLAGGAVPLGLLVPQAVAGVFLLIIGVWPFLEERVTGDSRQHHLLDRPRQRPARTAFGVAGLVFFLTLCFAGATDIVTTQFSIAFEHQVIALRTLLVIGPLVAFQLTRHICLALAAQEQEVAMRGHETGVISRSPAGGYTELRVPLHDQRAAAVQHEPDGHDLSQRERTAHQQDRRPRVERGRVA